MRKLVYSLTVLLSVGGATTPTFAATLAALGNVSTDGDKQAAETTIATGASAVIPGSSPLTGANMAISNSAYDETNNLLFVVDVTSGAIATSRLLTISMVDGSVVTNPLLSAPAAVIGVTDLEWDAGEAVLYGIVTVTGGDKQLATFNTTTGAVGLLGSPVAGGNNVGTFSQPFDLDAGGNRYYFVGSPAAGDTLYSLDTTDGTIADSKLLSTGGILPTGVTTLMGLEWDPADGLLALAALSTNDRQLATVDTTSGASFGTVTLLGPGGIEGGSLGTSGNEALDTTGNIYYFTGTDGSTAFLYKVNTTDGTATQSALSFGAGINDIRALEIDAAGALPVELLSISVE